MESELKIVKLDFNYDLDILSQTPDKSGIWGGFKFVVSDDVTTCDYYVSYEDYKIKKQKIKVNYASILITGEGPKTRTKFSYFFLRKFDRIISVDRNLKFQNIKYSFPGLPWWIDKSYDFLKDFKMPQKTKLISIISSDKSITPDHRQRLKFAYALKQHFQDKIDFFGRGINDFENKWDVIEKYKYHIAIENDVIQDYFTEKFTDSILGYSFPIYYGCSNIEHYFSSKVFEKIDIYNIEESINKIENLINDENRYSEFLKEISSQRDLILNTLQLFPLLVENLADFKKLKPKTITLYPNFFLLKTFKYYFKRVFVKLKLVKDEK